MSINPLVLARMERGLKSWQAAAAIGISGSYLTHIERGYYNPPQETKKRIAKFYGRPISELFPVESN